MTSSLVLVEAHSLAYAALHNHIVHQPLTEPVNKIQQTNNTCIHYTDITWCDTDNATSIHLLFSHSTCNMQERRTLCLYSTQLHQVISFYISWKWFWMNLTYFNIIIKRSSWTINMHQQLQNINIYLTNCVLLFVLTWCDTLPGSLWHLTKHSVTPYQA